MTEVVLVKYVIKQGQKEKWLTWCGELKRRESEVMETLENEGVISEACFLSSDEDSVYYMEAENLERAHSPPHRLPIDEEHKIVRRSTLLQPETTKVLFNFHRTE